MPSSPALHSALCACHRTYSMTPRPFIRFLCRPSTTTSALLLPPWAACSARSRRPPSAIGSQQRLSGSGLKFLCFSQQGTPPNHTVASTPARSANVDTSNCTNMDRPATRTRAGHIHGSHRLLCAGIRNLPGPVILAGNLQSSHVHWLASPVAELAIVDLSAGLLWLW